jgi:predicted metal-dependent hydrolase
MTVMTRAFRKKFELGVTQFNSGRFFEAHETWEALWRPLTGKSKRVMQGLIQAAVGAHHLQKGNRQGAQSLFRNALGKLSCGPRQFCRANLRQLEKDLSIASALLATDQPLAGVELPAIALEPFRNAHSSDEF